MKPTPHDVPRIGIREFRQHLSDHLAGDHPLAITRHGRTVGYYIPAAPSDAEAELEALERAAARLHHLLAEQGVSEDDIVDDFRRERTAGER